MFASGLEVGYGHLHRLDLLIFRRDGADFVAHLITFYRHILPFDAGQEEKEKLKLFNNRTFHQFQHHISQYCS